MLFQSFPVADCHCDTIGLLGRDNYRFSLLNPTGHVDLPRLVQGGVNLQFFAVCVATAEYSGVYLRQALENVHRYQRCLDENRGHLTALECLQDLKRAREEGKIACMLALEGAEPLEGSLELLEVFHRLGVRCLSLTWNKRNLYADGAGEDAAGGGLTRIGRKTIREMAELRIILDLAHISDRGFFEAVDLTAHSPLVSHANARKLCEHPRNLTDEQLKTIAAKGGVVGISFYPPFVSGQEIASLDQLVDHFVHIAEVAGVEHTAIGSDFDGMNATVDGLNDASCHGVLLEALTRRGFKPREMELIAGLNVRRIIEKTLAESIT